MDYQTARQFVLTQGLNHADQDDAFLNRLRQGKPPVPGQLTTLLLAIKVVFEANCGNDLFDRQLVLALYLLAWEGRRQYEAKIQQGGTWPPLLDEDLQRIAYGVKSIFSGVWETP